MTSQPAAENPRNFMLSTEIFEHPNLDIYAQMVCIVLRAYSAESNLPTLKDLARQGRMNPKQATRALQSLVELKILPHKLFRQIIGDFADDRLSWAAKGILAYCKDHPQIGMKELLELSSQSGDDEQSIRKALRELKRYGYLEEFTELRQYAN
jgi:hypothetical protein